MKNNFRVMYLRDKKRQGIGCIAMRVVKHEARIEYQLSVLNPLDHFSKPVARELAIGRLLSRPLAVSLPYSPTTHDISEAVMEAIKCGRGLPTRARKAASLWLRSNSYSVVEEKHLSLPPNTF